MKFVQRIKNKLEKSPFLANFTQDYGFRTFVFFVVSFVINVAYAVMNAVTGVRYRSIWFGSIAVYYIVLSLQRIFVLLFNQRVNKKAEGDEERLFREKLKIYLANGIFLLVLESALTLAIIQMCTSEKPVRTGEIMAIASAAYAFYKMTLAIINLVKARKRQDPVLVTMRNIGFVDAIVSMLALTTTLISTFGEVNEMRTMLVAVSVGASILTIGLGLYMVVHATVKLKEQKKSE